MERCAVLVPATTYIEPECDRALSVLEARGYAVRRVFGNAAIDQARSQMASDALSDGFDELMWIDADIAFDPDDVDRLRAHDVPMICGIYPKKGRRELACHLLPGTTNVVFGRGGRLIEIGYAATGFLYTKKCVYRDIVSHFDLPECNAHFGRPLHPFFLPVVVEEPNGAHWYLGEDFAFSERAKQAGHRIMADTSICLTHIGKYGYRWEDAGGTLPRYESYDFRVV